MKKKKCLKRLSDIVNLIKNSHQKNNILIFFGFFYAENKKSVESILYDSTD